MKDKLIAAATEAMEHAHCPYSSFQVGAAVLTADGRVFSGCNVENASYGLTICAERVAIFTAVANGHKTFEAMAVVASGASLPYPCGACRQVLVEFCGPDTAIHVSPAADPTAAQTYHLGDLLPNSFQLQK